MVLIFAHKEYPQIWKRGEPPTKVKARDVFEIKIDDEELLVVKKHLHRIPYSNNSSECYYGDMAKYIAKAIGSVS